MSAQIQIGALLLKKSTDIPSALFYQKLQKFLRGLELSDDDRAKLRAFLATKGKLEENCMRIMNYINVVDSDKKIELICNATHCALNGEMDLHLYFRVVNAINGLMEDDMEFLEQNVSVISEPKKNHFRYNYHISALCNIGAMTMNVYLKNGGEYTFTSFAKILDASTISFSNDAKYPNRKNTIVSCLKEELQ